MSAETFMGYDHDAIADAVRAAIATVQTIQAEPSRERRLEMLRKAHTEGRLIDRIALVEVAFEHLAGVTGK